jgi:hypothetical protein
MFYCSPKEVDMKWFKILIPVLVLFLVTASCLFFGGQTEEPQPEPGGAAPPVDDSIGTITRQDDVVEHNDEQVAAIDDLFQNDSLHIFNGGEGLLNFGSGLLIRMFNDTVTGGIRTENDPDSPLDVRMFLESGGFTGQLIEENSTATFETPNGAEIVVHGTDFLIVYDEETGVTTAGNWDGEMEMSAPGSRARVISPGNIRIMGWGEQPGPEIPLEFSRREFERRSRDLESPILAIKDLAPEIEDLAPPEVYIIDVDPDEIWIGKYCSDAPGTTQLTAEVFDDVGVQAVYAVWVIGGQKEQVRMTPIDDTTFTAAIGPVRSTGELEIQVFAEDISGKTGQSKTIVVLVRSCIG